MAEVASLPSSTAPSQSGQGANALSDARTNEVMKKNILENPEKLESTSSPRIARSVISSTVRKPIGTKKTGKGGGLGAQKLTRKPSESLYEQKPEEPPAPVASSTNNIMPSPSGPSRFEYVENVQSSELYSGSSDVISHVSVPKSSSFFGDFGMDGGFPKKSGSSSSKVEIQESDEARKKFSNAKSISSSQFFGDNKAADVEARATLSKFSGSNAISSADLFGGDSGDSSIDLAANVLLNRLSFQVQEDLSSLKNIAGETGKKLTSLASTLMSDFQDRIL